LACSKGLGEAADDDRLEALFGFRGVEGLEEGVVSAVDGAEVGDPAIPHPSLLLVGCGHGSDDAGSSRKMEPTHELISTGRGSIAKPAGICWGK
jgi:hypothetical protein